MMLLYLRPNYESLSITWCLCFLSSGSARNHKAAVDCTAFVDERMRALKGEVQLASLHLCVCVCGIKHKRCCYTQISISQERASEGRLPPTLLPCPKTLFDISYYTMTLAGFKKSRHKHRRMSSKEQAKIIGIFFLL